MIKQVIKITKREQDSWNYPVAASEIYTQFELDNYVQPYLDYLATIQGYIPSSLEYTIEGNTLTISRNFDSPEALVDFINTSRESQDPKALKFKEFLDARKLANPPQYEIKSAYADIPEVIPPEGTVPEPLPIL